MTLLKTPSILIFDVNETLLDLTSLEPVFVRVFGEARVMREWFTQLMLYSQTMTFSGTYATYHSAAPQFTESAPHLGRCQNSTPNPSATVN